MLWAMASQLVSYLYTTSLSPNFELTVVAAVWKNKHFHRRTHYRPHTLPALPENEFVECWKQVQNIALEPGVLFPSSRIFPTIFDTRAGISATFPQLRRISIVVNPFVDLENAVDGEAAVCPPTRRCRLVEASGDTTWPGMQPKKHWLDTIRWEVELLRASDDAITLSVQTFEVYAGRKRYKQWKKYPL